MLSVDAVLCCVQLNEIHKLSQLKPVKNASRKQAVHARMADRKSLQL